MLLPASIATHTLTVKLDDRGTCAMAQDPEERDRQRLRAARLEAKLALARAITKAAPKSVRERDCACIQGLAVSFNLIPPSFGAGPDAADGGVVHVHGGQVTVHAGGGGGGGGGGGQTHMHGGVPAPAGHAHGTQFHQHGDIGGAVDPTVAPLSDELEERLDHLQEHAMGEGGQSPSPNPLALTAQEAAVLRRALTEAKTAVAEAITEAASASSQDQVCACIQQLSVAFNILPAPSMVVGTGGGGGGHTHGAPPPPPPPVHAHGGAGHGHG